MPVMLSPHQLTLLMSAVINSHPFPQTFPAMPETVSNYTTLYIVLNFRPKCGGHNPPGKGLILPHRG